MVRREALQGHEETPEGDGFVHHVNCGDGFRNTYTSNFIELYTLYMCSFLYVNYVLVKLIFKKLPVRRLRGFPVQALCESYRVYIFFAVKS